MIIYVESKAFPYKSFVAVVKPGDRIARIRAQMLHILFEIGREEHLFRLRYNGQYLRDAFKLEDYEIKSNAVLHMVPLSAESGKDDSFSDMRSVTSSLTMNFDPETEKIPTVRSALHYEVKHFNRREKMIIDMRTLIYINFLTLFLSLLTTQWYSIFWLTAFVSVAWYLVPGYTRIGGYVGTAFYLRFWFCLVTGVLALALFTVDVVFSVNLWTAIKNHGCSGGTFEDDCSRKNVYSACFFTIHAVIVFLTAILCAFLYYSFRTEIGDVIEKYLVQEKDIEEVMRAASSGKLKERRTAAYEMATMAASSDDNKFRIVAEGGLNLLMNMSLCKDEPTQEYAIEALSELITIQTIQDNYVEMGGVRNLTALLKSSNAHIMQEAARALYTICQSDENRHAVAEDHGMQEAARALYTICQSDENRHAVAEDHGLSDLAYAAKFGSLETQRMVASIFLELTINTEIRSQLASRNIPAQALVHLCRSYDKDTLRFALLTLELLAIETPDVVCSQEDLLEILLDLPIRIMDTKLNVLAGKILLYFAENPQTKEAMMSLGDLKDALMQFVYSCDPILQKVVVKIIFCMMDNQGLKMRAKALKLDKVLSQCVDKAADKDVWEMADQGLQVMNTEEDNFPTLPVLSTIEKLSMGQGNSRFGSRTSLRSDSGGSFENARS